MRLACPLTDYEFTVRAKALAQTEEDLRIEEESQEAVKAGLKEALADIRKRRTMLAGIVSRGEEFRDVECEEVLDYTMGTVTRVRTDTGTLLVTRPMTDEERQRKLFTE